MIGGNIQVYLTINVIINVSVAKAAQLKCV